MKNTAEKKVAMIGLLAIILGAFLYAGNGEYIKEYKESYETNNNTTLLIDNKYGSVDINNWNENRVSIEVIVKVRANNKERADELFNKIDITIVKDGNNISGITDFTQDFGSMLNNRNDLFEIKYTVNMPTAIPLTLYNKYGNVFINELTSTSTIDIKYGNLKANKITHNDKQPFTQVILGYSNASIGTCTWIKFDVKYSNVDITESKALIFLSKYSKVNIEKGTSVVTEAKYDTYRLGRISNIVANAGYSNFKAQQISNKIQMETKYTDMDVSSVPSNFEEIKITSSYGNYKILIQSDASYKIDGYAKYAKISIPESSNVNRFNENNEFKVNGLVGENSATKSKVTVSSNYGGVKFIE